MMHTTPVFWLAPKRSFENSCSSGTAGFRPRVTLAAALLSLSTALLLGAAGRAVAGEHYTHPDNIQPGLIYHNYCSVCHGDHGDGQSRAQNALVPPPRDFTAPAAAAELSRARMITSVTYGRPGTAMVGWKTQLSDKEIGAVVDYVRQTFMKPQSGPPPAIAGISGVKAHGGRERDEPAAAKPAAPAADMSLPFPDKLTGDRTKGAAFYMGNCATCHGVKGNGEGPRAYFIVPRPRNFLDPATRKIFNRPALFNAIAHGKLGTEMPAWSKVLSDQEIANVAEFVFENFIRAPEVAKSGKGGK